MKKTVESFDNPAIVEYRSMSASIYSYYIILYIMGMGTNPFLYRLMDDLFHSHEQFEILTILAPVSIILGYILYTLGSVAIMFKVLQMDRSGTRK